MPWLTKELKEEIRKVFASRYPRKLTDNDVVEIAQNLTSFVEVYAKSKYESTK